MSATSLITTAVCVGCRKARFGVMPARHGAATLNLCPKCCRVNDATPVVADGPLPYVVTALDNVCICGSSPTHAEHCPAREVRS